MSLRFAIIKNIKTALGKHWEDVVYEVGEDKILEQLQKFTLIRLKEIKLNKYTETKYTAAQIAEAIAKAFEDTVGDFKKITLKIV